ncbi:MAG: hypothetical protein ABW171_06590 [Steroidobacter sp.]
MDYRDPITLIDESIENLTYLIDWLLEDIDVAALDSDLLAKDAVRSIAALRAIRALLPRLRVVRSNFESQPTLPDATRMPPDHALSEYVEKRRTQLRKLLNEPRGGSSVLPLSSGATHKPPQVRAAITLSLRERKRGFRRHDE